MEAATNKEIKVLTTKIPMEKKFIVDNFDNFKSEDIVFNVSLKDCDYKNPKSIFTYLANCEVSNPYLNFDELETQGLDFMFNYMIEYLSFDRIYSIPQFDRFLRCWYIMYLIRLMTKIIWMMDYFIISL